MSGALMMVLSAGRDNSVNLTDHSLSDSHFTIGTATANADILVRNDGVLAFLRTQGADGSYAGEWLVSGSAADFECRFTLLSGSVSGTFDTWLNLGTTRQVGVSAGRSTPGTTTQSGSVLLEIRRTGGAVIDSCTLTLSASATVDV